MNPIEKAVLKAASSALINIKKHYKLHRNMLLAPYLLIKPIYRKLDHKMMVEGREIPVRVFRAEKNAIPKVLLFFHGGGWVTGNIDTYTLICENMAKQTGHTVVSVNYRLAPENPFPAGLEDCYYVTQQILANPQFVKCKAEDITIIGDSAGGNLAAVVSLMAKDMGALLPCRQILLYPSTSFDHTLTAQYQSVRDYGRDYILTAERIENYMELYTQKKETRLNPYVAPILATDLSQQPKTLIITAECDPLRDEGEAYGQKLRAAGNDVQIHRIGDALHGFLALPKITKSVITCYEHINAFLNDEEAADSGM